MSLSREEERELVEFVKGEPRAMQEVAEFLDRSWVTADKYVKEVVDRTGLIDVKVFREGTRGALKLVYFVNPDVATESEMREKLLQDIMNGRDKTDFDFMELYQLVDESDKDAFFEEYERENVSSHQNLSRVFANAEDSVLCFSGNLSFVNVVEDGKSVPELMEKALERGVYFKIICRVDVGTLKNLDEIDSLLKKFPDRLDIRHAHHPLRGFIVDDRLARFKNEQHIELYRKGELGKNLRIFYEVFDESWVDWLQQIFWKIYRGSIDYETRIKEINKVFR